MKQLTNSILVIDNLNSHEINYGESYFQNNGKDYKINAGDRLIELSNLTDLTTSYHRQKDIGGLAEFHNAKIGMTDTEFLADTNFWETSDIKLKKSKTFNPFGKVNTTGKIKLNFKKDDIGTELYPMTKTQLKKILNHKDTKVHQKYVYTDDYRFDASENFQQKDINRLDLLQDVIELHACRIVYYKVSKHYVHVGGLLGNSAWSVENDNIEINIK